MRGCIPILGKKERLLRQCGKQWGGVTPRGDQEEAMETHLLQDISMFDS